MVANRLNPDISFFLALMHSPYLGNTNIVNGHAIYNALLCWENINPKQIEKVSFGIPQNVPIALKGSNKYLLNVREEPKTEKPKGKAPQRTVLDNLTKGYEAFKVLRATENSLTNPNLDNSPIPFEILKPKHGAVIAHKIDYFVFYIIWRDAVPDNDYTNTEFTLGAGRNNGFGFTRIEKVFHTSMEDLIAGAPNKFTATNGVKGIYNHARYGFGEYILDSSMTTGAKLVKLTTPLCMKSTYPKTTQYGTLPTFIKPVPYEKRNYYLWDKGFEHTLECIQSGKAFEIIQGWLNDADRC